MRCAVVATGLLLIHQPASPGARYTDPALKNTLEILNLLRYCTANGNKPYCDRNPATDIDKKWAPLHLAQGEIRSNVASILNR
jgi:hypothetical protein